MGEDAPFLIRLYGAAADLIAPLAYRRVQNKLSAQGTPESRLRERIGKATKPRPAGRLLWFHAASVGESLSVLRLIEIWGKARDDLSFLITSGTASSAKILDRRLPPRTTHQFAPLDAKPAMRRFLDHWQPDAAVFVESELWPQMLRETGDRGVPLALINARLSDRSARGWLRAPKTACYIMGRFRLVHCQDERTATHLRDMGAEAYAGQNLKAVSGPLPYDADGLAALQAAIGKRPVWLASSTHPGEDAIMLAAHKRLLETQPDALLILVPRHPERAAEIAGLIAPLDHVQRSTGAAPGGQVYLADTLGETGLWYALCRVTCLCGSFVPVGGHNPYEPAYAGSAVLHGPLYANFAAVYPQMEAAGAAREVADAEALAEAVAALWRDEAALNRMQDRARHFATAQEDMLEGMIARLSEALDV